MRKHVAKSSEVVRRLLHELWSNQPGEHGYDKEKWRQLQSAIEALIRLAEGVSPVNGDPNFYVLVAPKPDVVDFSGAPVLESWHAQSDDEARERALAMRPDAERVVLCRVLNPIRSTSRSALRRLIAACEELEIRKGSSPQAVLDAEATMATAVEYARRVLAQGAAMNPRPCPACSGTGNVPVNGTPNGLPCDACDGEGEMRQAP